MSEIHPIEFFMNNISEQWQKERSETQMTLGELIKALKALDPETIINLGNPHSYRGYYRDLAFEIGFSKKCVDFLEECKNCMGKVFEGYKGGNFYMNQDTPVWISSWGICSNDRLMKINLDGSIETSKEENESE